MGVDQPGMEGGKGITRVRGWAGIAEGLCEWGEAETWWAGLFIPGSLRKSVR